MTTDAPEAALADLLAHAGWLSELARQLAREDVAADAVQQTWLAALRSPPAPGRPPRPWLSRVLLNFVRQRARAEGRRGRHEQNVATGLPLPPGEAPDALYERMDIQRALAARVMELPEPYRRVVLLRYYEGQSAEEIARALGVPAGTVPWRLPQ
jgi:RNA polymerase sigma-70 factor (ECF subfamily)